MKLQNRIRKFENKYSKKIELIVCEKYVDGVDPILQLYGPDGPPADTTPFII